MAQLHPPATVQRQDASLLEFARNNPLSLLDEHIPIFVQSLPNLPMHLEPLKLPRFSGETHSVKEQVLGVGRRALFPVLSTSPPRPRSFPPSPSTQVLHIVLPAQGFASSDTPWELDPDLSWSLRFHIH